MKTLLITAIGGDVAQAIARIVRRERPNLRIIGVDIHVEHAGALFVDAVEVVPRASSPDYEARMVDLVTRHQVDWCLLGSEAELAYVVGRRLTAFGQAPLIGVSPRSVEVGLDKLATADFLRDIGLPAPWTIAASEGGDPLQLPCIFKPRRSAGSKGVAICREPADLVWHAAHEPNGIYQELLLPPERELTCAVYRRRDGRVAVLPMLRRLSGGFTNWFRVVEEPEAQRQCERLAEGLDLWGPMNVQMRITNVGPKIFEINPRFSSTVYMRHLIGFRDVIWLLDEMNGTSPVFPPLPLGATVSRVQDAAVLGSGAIAQ